MNTITRGVVVILVAIAALLGGYFAQLWLVAPEPAEDTTSQALLTATLDDLNGSKQALTQWQGKVMVVNFWATWCAPCLKEIPEFIRLQEKMGARGVQFIGIAIDDRTKVAGFAATFGINYPILMAENEGIALMRSAGNRLGGLPFTVIIDRQGKMAKVVLGTLDEKKLTPVLESLL